MVIPTPLTLGSQGQPFDDPDWLYEIKHDGFRALAVVENGRCRFFSRNKHRLTGFRDLAEAIVKELNVESAILDGELVATDGRGRTVFAALMQRSRTVRYYSFDLMWLNGEDLRRLPLRRRKEKLKQVMPSRSPHLLYVDHTKGAGTELYRLACQLDLEGIVAKKADSPYDDMAKGNWIKIKNPSYSQKEGRGDWFKRVG
jgi:bifunctional non-homologous end joining protein LigD